jgi:hypothetical protein
VDVGLVFLKLENELIFRISARKYSVFNLEAGFRIRIHFLRIRIQRIRIEDNTDPDPDPIRIQGFNDQKLKKITAEKKNLIFFYQKLQFTYP